MEVIAKARYIRISPRKVRLVADLVRGMDVDQALNQLRFYRKAAALPLIKLIESGVANAEHNFKLSGGLFIKKLTVDGGPTLKRWRARAFGRAAPIRKRSSHINLVLEERQAKAAPKGLKGALVKTAAAVKPAAKAPATEQKKAADAAKKAAKPAAPAKKAAAKPKAAKE